jgi:hypothetical protein
MKRVVGLVLGGLIFVVACGSSGRDTFEDKNANDPADGGGGSSGGGFHDGKGCQAGGKVCVGNDVHECGADGQPGKFVKSCDATAEFCLGGECSAGCEAAEGQASNVGCEFWAIDLDNEYSQLNDAAGAAWGVVVSNFGKTPAEVVIEQNDAPVGQPPKVTQVKTLTIAPGSLSEIALPTREVDGSTNGKDEGPGTFVSSNAYRIRTSAPVVVYQFNTLKNSFSNDASLLLPKNGLGNVYRVLGWATANPIALNVPGAPAIPGIPDHSFVTIAGTVPGTKVSVKLGGPIVSGSGIAAMNKGDVVTATLGPFDVMNLESNGVPGDLTGTIAEASAPVVVFTGGERGIAPIGKDVPKPPDWDGESKLCCTDHLEEQLLPVTSYGKTFVVTRSPIRSKGWVEPDLLRFMGVAAKTTVKTSLPAPFDQFTLEPGEVKNAWTTTDFVVEATEPLAVAQILVSQTYTYGGPYTGDPSLTIFPPVDQYRRDYLFNVPTSWDTNHVVIAAPVGTNVTIDGKAPAGCVVAPAGKVGTTSYEARRCPIGEGAHRMNGDAPFGIVAYGYGRAGSYAVIGGANVRKIYEPPPLK